MIAGCTNHYSLSVYPCKGGADKGLLGVVRDGDRLVGASREEGAKIVRG